MSTATPSVKPTIEIKEIKEINRLLRSARVYRNPKNKANGRNIAFLKIITILMIQAGKEIAYFKTIIQACQKRDSLTHFFTVLAKVFLQFC